MQGAAPVGGAPPMVAQMGWRRTRRHAGACPDRFAIQVGPDELGRTGWLRGERMVALDDLLEAFIEHVGVDLGGRHVGVAQHLLQRPQIGAVRQ